jgi:hypothetical protein
VDDLIAQIFLGVQTYYHGGFALSQKNGDILWQCKYIFMMVLCSHENITYFLAGLNSLENAYSRVLYTITDSFRVMFS